MNNPMIKIMTTIFRDCIIFTSCGLIICFLSTFRSLPFRKSLKLVLLSGCSMGGSDSLYKSARILIRFK